jgi:autotransporter-associated beta strand protein
VLTGGITLNGTTAITAGAGSMQLNGVIHSSAPALLRLTGGNAGNVTQFDIGGNNTFTGGISIGQNTTVRLTGSGAMNASTGSEATVGFYLGGGGSSTGGILSLNGNSVSLAALTSDTNLTLTPIVRNANATAATLTVGNGLGLSGTFAGALQDGTGSGALSLIKAGSGRLLLSGSSSFTGSTTIAGGTLAIGPTGSFADSAAIIVGNAGSTGAVLDLTAKSGAIVFGPGQTLGGGGTVRLASSGTLNVLGTFAPGNSPGLFTYDDGTTLLSGTTVIEIMGTNRAFLSSHGVDPYYDAVNVINGGLLDFANGTLHLTFGQEFAANTSFELFDALGEGSLAGNFGTVTVFGSFYTGLEWSESNGVWKSSSTGSGQSLEFSSVTGQLIIVPEPTTWLLAGCGIIATLCAAQRRRLRRKP